MPLVCDSDEAGVTPLFPRNPVEIKPKPHPLGLHCAPPGIASRRHTALGAAAGGDGVADEGSGLGCPHSRGETEKMVWTRFMK